MTKRAKRGTLSSALLTPAESAPARDETPTAPSEQGGESRAEQPAAGLEPGRALSDEIARKIAVELQAANNLLFRKGAASAEGFRPAYWSYDEPDPPASANEPADSEMRSAGEVSRPPPVATRKGAHHGLWLALAASSCSCLALILPGVIFVLSVSRPADEGPAILPPPSAAEERAPERPQPFTSDTASLVARGDTFLGTGDIASARLFYEQAADAGSARAAMFLGLTFDPAFLDRAHARGLHGDVTQAAMWYRRARDLGEPEAVRLLSGLSAK